MTRHAVTLNRSLESLGSCLQPLRQRSHTLGRPERRSGLFPRQASLLCLTRTCVPLLLFCLLAPRVEAQTADTGQQQMADAPAGHSGEVRGASPQRFDPPVPFEAGFPRSGADLGGQPAPATKSLPHPTSSARPLPMKSEGTPSTTRDRAPTQTTNALWRTAAALVGIIVFILVAARYLKRHRPACLVGIPDEAIRILGSRPLNRQHTIQLVRCGSRILVLGISADSINTLTEITDPLEVDLLTGLCRRKDGESSMTQAFRTLFQKQVYQTSRADRTKRAAGRPDTGADVSAHQLPEAQLESLPA